MPQVKRITNKHVADWEAAKTTPPKPFTKAPQRLTPFLDSLDTKNVYITHIDRFPSVFKRRIFLVPVILNLSIFLLLVWRIYAIFPFYMGLLNTILGYASPLTVDRSKYTTKGLVWIVVKRALTFGLDFVLFRFVLPWPITFFLEQPSNPAHWRWTIGFRDDEVVVRESRRWGAKELVGSSKAGEESPFWKTRVLTGVDRQYCREKSGYMMMGKDWDLDFFGMVKAHELVDKKTLVVGDFEKQVLAYKEGVGWMVWRVHEKDRNQEEEEQRKKIVALKDRLTGMGKESLFFRWIEIVQYESSQPGGFDRKRQEQTMEKIKAEFTKQGVDFDQIVKEVGGLEGTPGM
ncbi:hypothetical protein BDZ85DRAFT_257849 [Elsinoe ampelina]|uniref:Uncharacterized protein n=1 Tax=Elsinoe ampelina TaxID=302913 RepID=A0A6A6GIS0_9PEZI|nr:hypothetical protein BDZ85DRAFT_257849 [Elsinoe ampelina]